MSGLQSCSEMMKATIFAKYGKKSWDVKFARYIFVYDVRMENNVMKDIQVVKITKDLRAEDLINKRQILQMLGIFVKQLLEMILK